MPKADRDAPSSPVSARSCQYYIDTGAYLTEREKEKKAEPRASFLSFFLADDVYLSRSSSELSNSEVDDDDEEPRCVASRVSSI